MAARRVTQKLVTGEAVDRAEVDLVDAKLRRAVDLIDRPATLRDA